MEIKPTLTNRASQVLNTIYYERVDPTHNLDGKVLLGVHAFCFCGEKMDLLPIDAPIHSAIATWQWGKYLPRETVTVKVTPYIRMSSHSSDMSAKISGSYANSILALLEAKKSGFDKALFLDKNGCIAEGAGEKIFFVKDKSLHTPTIDAILPGITRTSIMNIATDLGLIM